MKKLFIILILLLSVITSCETPEKKVLDSFNENRISRRKTRTLEVKGAEIYDTLYYTDLTKAYNKIENDKPYFEKRLKMMDNYRDSVISLKLEKPMRDSLMRIGFMRRERYDRKLDHLIHQEGYIYTIFRNSPKDTIYAYYVRILTDKDTLLFIVNHKFEIICPVFMYEE